ncbi:hypothetical protein AC630_18960 [Bradyrhizobium sp. AS23.2]|nr:hypothetical protein AC630_18960 [Bradyrhizobium sp. AS23.2]
MVWRLAYPRTARDAARPIPYGRLTLARWLRDERYDEDAPRGFQKVEKASKPAKQATATKPKPASRTTVRVTSADVVTIGDVTELRVLATDAEGHEHERIIELEHPDMETQFAGQRLFAQLVHAAGLEQIADGEELHGRTVVITEDGFTAPTTRPDDEPPLPVKPEPVEYSKPQSTPEPRREPTEWERKKAAQWRRESAERRACLVHPTRPARPLLP